MNAFLPAAVFGLLATLPLAAQVAIPATPKKFDTQRIGDAASGGSTVNAAPVKPPPIVKTITHIVLGEPRQWKMTDGKSYLGKLIAFEDIVVVGNAPATLTVPKNPTVVREGKARLLLESKPYEVPLQNFGAEERKFIEETRAALTVKK